MAPPGPLTRKLGVLPDLVGTRCTRLLKVTALIYRRRLIGRPRFEAYVSRKGSRYPLARTLLARHRVKINPALNVDGHGATACARQPVRKPRAWLSHNRLIGLSFPVNSYVRERDNLRPAVSMTSRIHAELSLS